ncbi:MAG: hypothetical protein ACTHMS_05740 [Jatrophihabitans sp.]|uniref:hypothetical protein n=1 Tax=Jatrophihabitans sp. TaxID=1932789 RepID=UPI003F8086BD
MSVSIADLLSDLDARLDRDAAHTTAHQAHAAVSVFEPLARAVDALTPVIAARAATQHRQQDLTLIGTLRDALGTAAAAWPALDCPHRDLAGAAADLTAKLAPHHDDAAQARAVLYALSGTARRAARAARGFPPYDQLPQLVAIPRAAAGIDQHATAHPPTRRTRAALDALLPVTRHPTIDQTSTLRATVDALTSAVHAASRNRTLVLHELLGVATACAHAAQAGVNQLPQPRRERPWRAAPEAWHAVAIACAPFDDGTKRGIDRPSDALRLAARLVRTLDQTAAARIDAATADVPGAGEQQRVLDRLPEIAVQLSLAVQHWAIAQTLFAPERLLPSYETRNWAAPVNANRIVLVEAADLEGLSSAIYDAERLSAALAVTSERHARHVPPEAPHQAISTAPSGADESAPRDASPLRRSADQARARAAATVTPNWSYGRRSAPRR